VHRAKPSASLIAQGAFQRADGLWVYQTVAARELWDTVMKSAYDFAEPGILFLDHINLDNNLSVLRVDCGDQSLRRAAVAPVRLLRPGSDHPDALRAPPVRVRWRAGVRF
jgi:hypothetical protein